MQNMDDVEKLARASSRRASHNMSRSISRSFSRSMEDVFSGGRHSRRSSRHAEEDEEALKWAAIEKLPTYDRLRTTIMKSFVENELQGTKMVHKEVDVSKLDMNDRQMFIDMLFKVAEEDNEKFLRKFRQRIDKVGIRLPTVEVRFENLTVEADCQIGSRALPTLPNVARNIAESAIGMLGINMSKRTKLTILKDVSGILKPSRMTLLLGPPSSGKTTLLLALAGKLDPNLKVSGDITYNGYKLNEFVPRKTSAYISQNDVHVGVMTVKETLDFSARCQGVGTRYDLLTELARREKDAGIFPEAEVDLFMKATAMKGAESNLFTDYTLKPAPETFELFDDVILLSEGRIVYQGPRQQILEFFESCGFRCPERKGTADFLQEVTSKKDQEQYWAAKYKPYRYISVPEFAERFKKFHVGMHLENDLSVPFDKSRGHRAALAFTKYSVPKMDLLKACWDKEWLLIKRNSVVFVSKTVQIIIVAIIASTVFIKPRMHTGNEADGSLYVGALLFTMIINMFNGFAELSLMISRLPVFYKQRDLLFHHTLGFHSPNFPAYIAHVHNRVYCLGVFFKHLLLVFLTQQMAAGLFRLIAGFCRTMIIANTGGVLILLLIFLLGGFIIPKGQIPNWWEWAYWISPLSYGYNAFAVNELYAPRWMNRLASDNSTRLGEQCLRASMFSATRTAPGNKQAIISEESAKEMEGEEDSKGQPRLRMSKSNHHSLSSADGNNPREMAIRKMSSRSNPNGLSRNADSSLEGANGFAPKRGMVLPFTPLAMSFNSVNYYVDMPAEMKQQGVPEDRLQLLREVTGAFRPGVLTALMGVSGAGKTTLMDVLAGRKTGGYIEGDIRISGFPKKQETFARISGYCEQNDIHSPQVTVRESLIYSAFLRLPKEVSKEEKMIFVDEVMELVELDNLKDAIVGLPGLTGLSTEQRKRLTIAVELVANPSIIFMDEPTSGLDARAAAIVMRTVRNTVDTGRTVVCTIHQPSIDIFEAFDELLLMKRGGQVIYSGPLGRNSHKIIEYFEEIPGVPKIKDKYNPATWMLEVSSVAAEVRLGIDFAEHYKSSSLYQRNKALVKELSTPPAGAKDLYFASQYSQSPWGQFKSCLWKQWWTYWRSPDYNLVRYFFTLAAALMVGTIFWKVGTKKDTTTDLRMIIGAMYAAVLFIGINNCSTVQPVIAVERSVFYRERAAGMYSALPYALAQPLNGQQPNSSGSSLSPSSPSSTSHTME
ncbi:hypothetical protein GH714_020610 [Hevea brasiliensis]|uniref:ABC transporter domain-containing protein n=1 Tax=Hevea brasiliensis TaxID=3981 RepID=A0A6A6LNH2_HEVBR|nr:hypothetical protein GH714_020610 [Hevea brasiliensis]